MKLSFQLNPVEKIFIWSLFHSRDRLDRIIFKRVACIFTGRGPHAYETAAVAKAGPAMRLIRRCLVIVEGEVRLAGRRVHADRVADQNFTLAALAELRAFRLVLAVQLHESSTRLVGSQFKEHSFRLNLLREGASSWASCVQSIWLRLAFLFKREKRSKSRKTYKRDAIEHHRLLEMLEIISSDEHFLIKTLIKFYLINRKNRET